MPSIYDLSWSETSFRAKLALFFKSRKGTRTARHSSDLKERTSGYSALSSTYYSITGTGKKHLDSARSNLLALVGWVLTWLPLFGWCYWRMLPLSDKAASVGYERMTADQMDIRQSILRARGKYEEARKCIKAALWSKKAASHTLGLLHVGMADVYLRLKGAGFISSAVSYLLEAHAYAEASEHENPRQASRIYKKCAVVNDVLDLYGAHTGLEGEDLRKKAWKLAEQAGAKDQLLKLKQN